MPDKQEVVKDVKGLKADREKAKQKYSKANIVKEEVKKSTFIANSKTKEKHVKETTFKDGSIKRRLIKVDVKK